MTPARIFTEHPVYLIANLLVIVGALVWLGVGALHTNYVTKFLPAQYANYVFILVGVAGIITLYQKVMMIKASTEHMTVDEILTKYNQTQQHM